MQLKEGHREELGEGEREERSGKEEEDQVRTTYLFLPQLPLRRGPMRGRHRLLTRERDSYNLLSWRSHADCVDEMN